MKQWKELQNLEMGKDIISNVLHVLMWGNYVCKADIGPAQPLISCELKFIPDSCPGFSLCQQMRGTLTFHLNVPLNMDLKVL